ncbi:MAG: hypothetical protein HOO95_06810 [Gallionella sp.]|nr:hypothetical protein [Gallionella sp.]
MMQMPNGLIPSLLAITLASISVIGCIQFGETPDGYESDDDCKFCHASTKRAKDISSIYTDPSSHHPIDIEYPPLSNRANDFNVPNARDGKTTFFDINADGKLDRDEIRLYSDKGIAELTCATCHREHSKSLATVEQPDDDYLRGTNVEGELCLVCHRKAPKPISHQ